MTDDEAPILKCSRIDGANLTRTSRYAWLGLLLVLIGAPIGGGFMAFFPLFGAVGSFAHSFTRDGGLLFLTSLALAGLGSLLVAHRLGSPHVVVVGADGIRLLGTVRRRF